MNNIDFKMKVLNIFEEEINELNCNGKMIDIGRYAQIMSNIELLKKLQKKVGGLK